MRDEEENECTLDTAMDFDLVHRVLGMSGFDLLFHSLFNQVLLVLIFICSFILPDEILKRTSLWIQDSQPRGCIYVSAMLKVAYAHS